MSNTNISIAYFITDNGLRLSKVQPGDAGLPFGCHYDEGERAEHFLKRINEDIFPLLHFLEKCIQNEFNINNTHLGYVSWIRNHDETGTDLNSIQKISNDYIFRWGVDGFDCYINIELDENGDWGTQLNFYIDKITWTDFDDTQNFPVWLIGMAGVTETIDNPLSSEKMQLIIDNVLEELRFNKKMNENQGD